MILPPLVFPGFTYIDIEREREREKERKREILKGKEVRKQRQR